MITGTQTGQYTNATSGARDNVVSFGAYIVRNGIKSTPVYRHPDYADAADIVSISDYR